MPWRLAWRWASTLNSRNRARQSVTSAWLIRAAAAKRFKAPGFSPYAGRNYPARAYWGDSHLHTAMSLDARTAGNSLGPEEALRFARGEEVVSADRRPGQALEAP